MATKKKVDEPVKTFADTEGTFADTTGTFQPVPPVPMTPAEAADAVVKMGRTFQSLIDIAKEVERIGSIQQAEAEANALLIKSRAELDKLSGSIATAKEKESALLSNIKGLEETHNEFLKIRAGWMEETRKHEEADGALETARQAMAKANEDAGKEAVKKIADAEARSKKIVEDANKVKAEAAADRKAAKDEVAELALKVAAANSELADVNAKIAAAKEQVSKMLGGFGTGL